MKRRILGDPCPHCGGTEYYCAEEADRHFMHLQAEEQGHAADWFTELAEMTDDQVARRHLLVSAECIRDMGDWHGYEMHAVTMSELEREIRESERERCAVLCDAIAHEYRDLYADHRNQERQYIARRCAAALRAGGAE